MFQWELKQRSQIKQRTYGRKIRILTRTEKLACVCGWDGFNMVERKRKGRLDYLQHTEMIQVQMQSSLWVKLQKPTTNQWVSKSGGCSTAAEEERGLNVRGGVADMDGQWKNRRKN